MLLTDGMTTKKGPKLLVSKTPLELAMGRDQVIRDVKRILTLLARKVKRFYGFREDRVVFLDHDLWVWSIDLSKAEGCTALETIEERHFFAPREFIRGNNGVDGAVTAASTMVFPKEGELAVGYHALDWPFVGASPIAKGLPKRPGFGHPTGKVS